MKYKKQLIERRNTLITDMEKMCNVSEIRKMGEKKHHDIFELKKRELELLDKELREILKGEPKEMKKGNKLIEFRTLSTNEGTNFLENDVAKEIVKTVFEGEKVLEGVKVYNSMNHTLDVVVENGIGTEAVLVGEGAEGGVDDTLDTKKVSFEAERVTTTLNVTNKMLLDTSFDLDSYITDIMTRRLRRKLVDLVVNGTVDNKFIGLTSKQAINVDALDYDALVDLVYTMPTDLVENNVVIANRNDFKKILKIKDSTGSPIVLANIEEKGAKYTIFGHEIIINDKVAEGTIVFANLSQAIGMLVKDGITITKVSNTDANLVRKGITQYTIDLYVNIKTLNENAIEILKVGTAAQVVRTKKVA